jgi:Protein of unknown function (DUF2933)
MVDHRRFFWMTPQGLAALGLIGAVTYFLLMEHRQHLFAALPFLILLACPLMHLFMHGGHGVHGRHQHNDVADNEAYRRGFDEARRRAGPHRNDGKGV